MHIPSDGTKGSEYLKTWAPPPIRSTARRRALTQRQPQAIKPAGWVQRSVTRRSNERNDKHGNESMGCGAVRLHPSYGLRMPHEANR